MTEPVRELADLAKLDAPALSLLLPSPVHRLDHSSDFGEFRDPPTAAGVWFSAGDPVLVLVAVSPTRVITAEPEVSWQGPSRPVLRARASMSHSIADSDALLAWLQERVRTVMDLRSRRFRRCDECGQTNPPEWMHGDDLCHACAVRNHGIVY